MVVNLPSIYALVAGFRGRCEAVSITPNFTFTALL